MFASCIVLYIGWFIPLAICLKNVFKPCCIMKFAIGGTFASHCREEIGVDFRAPVAIRKASFCILSNVIKLLLHAVISMGLLYAIFPLIKALKMFSRESLSAPYFVFVMAFMMFLLFVQSDIRFLM